MRADKCFIPSLARRQSKVTSLWSRDEVSRLRELAQSGASLRMISMTLRRTESAVKNKAGMHGISLHNSNR
jgi:hypothetical protein